ncbi:metal ABC transporter solute-binding protein, Zn/Mn family [Porphyromonas pogonae]|uniref:metal ABC transporter solute-binding protein, Zn/Mn family n=1 Tax=Porphyromonas pogonae TaxID=867595 RepID=UPI002E7A6E7D|nr:zinc ABC transporter substrate-binding protein [Porphyromonas pogonae]
MKHIYFRYFSLLFIGFTLFSCTPAAKRKKQIAVTIEPQKAIIKTIADTLFDVVTLVPKGQSPETYDPSPQEMQQLADCEAYFYIGQLGFEKNWVKRIGEVNAGIKLFDMEPQVGGCTSAPGNNNGTCNSDHKHDDTHICTDPHYWTSISGALELARNTYAALVSLSDPHDSISMKMMERNYNSLVADIDKVGADIKSILSGVTSRSFVIFHPSLTDFAKDFNLTQLVVEQHGKDPNPAQLRDLIDRARHDHVKVVLLQPEFNTDIIRNIAQEINAEIVTINPLDGDWKAQMYHVARSIAHADQAHH